MSKSKGNLVAPEEIVDRHGADALRLAHLQAKPPADDVDWEDFGIEGAGRFLARLWRLAVPDSDLVPSARHGERTAADEAVHRSTHKMLDRITSDYDRWSYNTAVAAAMEFTNELYRYVQSDDGPHGEVLDDAVDTLLLRPGAHRSRTSPPSCGNNATAITSTSGRGRPPIPIC